MEALYRERRSWLHSVPAGLKLLLVAVLGTVFFLVARLDVLSGAALACSVMVASLGRPGPGVRRLLLGMAVAVVLIIGFHAWQGQVRVGLTSSLRLWCACLLGVALSASTRYTELLEVIERLLAPLARTGVRTDRLALQLALMLRFIDHFFGHWQRLAESHRLRTGRSGGLGLVAPMVILMLRSAQRVADTLELRWPRR
ncbi:MAG: energy-coupling factor transporter transmembrane component T [Burkholderiaceae bacterium]